MDGHLDRLHDVVVHKLEGDAALKKFDREAQDGEPSARTQERLRDSVADAIAEDPQFATELENCLKELRETAGPGQYQIWAGWMQGVQLGNGNIQTNDFTAGPSARTDR